MPRNTSPEIDDDDNARKVFIEDISEKNLVNRSTRVSVTKKKPLIPPKKELEKLNGRVITMSIYEKIPTYEDFSKLNQKEKLDTLNGLEAHGHTRQAIADAWKKDVQAIHDMTYRIKKALKKKEGVTYTTTKETSKKDEIIPLNDSAILPFYVTLIRTLSGDRVQSFVDDVMKLADKERIHNFVFALKKVATRETATKFNFSIDLKEDMSWDAFHAEVNQVLKMLGRGDEFQVTLAVKELNKLVPKQEPVEVKQETKQPHKENKTESKEQKQESTVVK